MARGEVTGRKPLVSADHIEIDYRSGPPVQDLDAMTLAELVALAEENGVEDADTKGRQELVRILKRLLAIPNEINATPHAEPKVKRRMAKGKLIRGPPVQPMAYSIKQFCQAHGISEMTYHRLRRLGLGPRTMKVLNRTIITHEAAADWRREREGVAKKNETIIEKK
jgi:hypothetical protein